MGDTIDMHDWGDWDDDYPTSNAPTCKRCGKEELTWYNLGTVTPEWRLFEERDGRLIRHVCRAKDHSNAFEDES